MNGSLGEVVFVVGDCHVKLKHSCNDSNIMGIVTHFAPSGDYIIFILT